MTPAQIQAAAYEGHPFLKMVPKSEDFTGAELPLPIIYANPQGRSLDFGTPRHAPNANPFSVDQTPAFRLFRSALRGGPVEPGEVAEFGAKVALALYGIREGIPWRPIAGVGDWLPAALNHDDEFFGIRRPVDRIRLAGHVLDGRNAGGVVDAVAEAFHEIDTYGGQASHVFLPQRMAESLKRSFRAWPEVVLNRETGAKARFVVDPDCPEDRVFVLTLETWRLYSLGPAITAVDGYPSSLRLACYAQLGCASPMRNAVVLL